MAASISAVSNKLLHEQIRRHLEGLKRTPDGSFLYGLIERGLRRYGTGDLERAFVAFLHALLARYVRSPAGDAATRFKARIILQYLAPLVLDRPAETSTRPAPRINRRRAMDALRAARGGEPHVGRAEKHLADQLADALAGSKMLETLLKDDPEALARLDRAGDHDDLKRVLIRGIRELVTGQRTLREHLRHTETSLREVMDDRRLLREALGRARRSNPTDETTGLLRRTFFMKQLEAEVNRAARYGFSLALGLIRLDGLEAVGETHGMAALEQLLRRLASEMQAQFRGHDLVARLGEDEFAVLLPNTRPPGALLAIEKLQKHCARLRVAHDGRDIKLPALHGALAGYSLGEPAGRFIMRARQALERARKRADGQIEVAPTPLA
jgi:diguanylate cyclase (GGDEF)-like protein